MYKFYISIASILIDACMASTTSANTMGKGTVVTTPVSVNRESVDSLGRDGADAQYMQYLSNKSYNFTSNMLKAY